MGDRSFLTELLVLVLAATFAFPCLGCGSAGYPLGSISGGTESRRVDQGGVNVLPHAYLPLPDRHGSKLRGVLDDAPAIFGDDSEDWLEGPTGFAPAYPAAAVSSVVPVGDQLIGTMAAPSLNHASPIHFLCSYQC